MNNTWSAWSDDIIHNYYLIVSFITRAVGLRAYGEHILPMSFTGISFNGSYLRDK